MEQGDLLLAFIAVIRIRTVGAADVFDDPGSRFPMQDRMVSRNGCLGQHEILPSTATNCQCWLVEWQQQSLRLGRIRRVSDEQSLSARYEGLGRKSALGWPG